MEKLLHIGMHKTGTTTIQFFMWQNRDLLRGKYKLLYPQTGKPEVGHTFGQHLIAEILRKNLEIKHIENIRKKLEKEINETNPYKILISSESFSLLNLNQIKLLREIYKPNVIIVYFRRQDQAIESIYKEQVKNKNTKIYEYFSNKFIEKFKHKLYYLNICSSWHKAFPEARIIPRIYDRKLFPERNIILDFLSILGIDMPEANAQNIEANPSLSIISTLVLRKINEKFNISFDDHKEIVKYLINIDRKEECPIKTFFALSERIKLLEHFSYSNNKLFKEWFGMENKFLLSEEEIKFYEEQDRIPKIEIEKMVDERYKRVLSIINKK